LIINGFLGLVSVDNRLLADLVAEEHALSRDIGEPACRPTRPFAIQAGIQTPGV
jgi:hypothetical protein